MVISHENQTLVESTLHCHDSYFKSFSVDFERRVICIVLTKSWASNIRRIQFTDYLFCTMTGFEPWGSGCSILGWQILAQDEAAAVFDVSIRQEDKNQACDLSLLLCSEFVLDSGDRIRIVCKSAEVELWG